MWLKEICTKAEISQEQLARVADITQQGYSHIERGERSPSVPVAKKIAAALGFNWQRFYEEPSEEVRA